MPPKLSYKAFHSNEPNSPVYVFSKDISLKQHNKDNIQSSAVVRQAQQPPSNQKQKVPKDLLPKQQFYSAQLSRQNLNLIAPSSSIIMNSEQSGISSSIENQAVAQTKMVTLTINSAKNKVPKAQWEAILNQRNSTTKNQNSQNKNNTQGNFQFQVGSQSKKGSKESNTALTQFSKTQGSRNPKPVALKNKEEQTYETSEAALPATTKSTKSQKSNKVTFSSSQKSKNKEAERQDKRSFTCAMVQGQIRLTKKSPSAGKDPNAQLRLSENQKSRDKSSTKSNTKGSKASKMQQLFQASGPAPQNSGVSTNKASCELVKATNSRTKLDTSNRHGQPMLSIQPLTTKNDRNSKDSSKLLLLKNFQPSFQTSSTTPKQFKIKQSSKFSSMIQTNGQTVIEQIIPEESGQSNVSPKHRGRSVGASGATQSSVSKSKNKEYGDQKGKSKKAVSNTYNSQAQFKSGSNQKNTKLSKVSVNNRTSVMTQNQNQVTFQRPVAQAKRGGHQKISHSTQPTNVYTGTRTAMNKHSELSKRFNRRDISSPNNDVSSGSGQANKSFQFGHQTGLMSLSSGRDSSNPPANRHRSSSGKNGPNIKITTVRNTHGGEVLKNIQPYSSTSAGASKEFDNQYINLKKSSIVPATAQNQSSTKKFLFSKGETQKETHKKSLRNQGHGSFIGAKVPKEHASKKKSENSLKKRNSTNCHRVVTQDDLAPHNQQFLNNSNSYVEISVEEQHNISLNQSVKVSEDEFRNKSKSKNTFCSALQNHTISSKDKSNLVSGVTSLMDNGNNIDSTHIHSDLGMPSQEFMLMSKSDKSGPHNKDKSHEAAEYHRMAVELKHKQNEIIKLMSELNQRDQLVHQLTVNMDNLENQVKQRDEKREQSQKAIRDTLQKLENKLLKFTSISKKNNVGLKQINLRKYESSNKSKEPRSSTASPKEHSVDYKSQFMKQVHDKNELQKATDLRSHITDTENNSLITIGEFAKETNGEINYEQSLLQDSVLQNIVQLSNRSKNQSTVDKVHENVKVLQTDEHLSLDGVEIQMNESSIQDASLIQLEQEWIESAQKIEAQRASIASGKQLINNFVATVKDQTDQFPLQKQQSNFYNVGQADLSGDFDPIALEFAPKGSSFKVSKVSKVKQVERPANRKPKLSKTFSKGELASQLKEAIAANIPQEREDDYKAKGNKRDLSGGSNQGVKKLKLNVNTKKVSPGRVVVQQYKTPKAKPALKINKNTISNMKQGGYCQGGQGNQGAGTNQPQKVTLNNRQSNQVNISSTSQGRNTSNSKEKSSSSIQDQLNTQKQQMLVKLLKNERRFGNQSSRERSRAVEGHQQVVAVNAAGSGETTDLLSSRMHNTVRKIQLKGSTQSGNQGQISQLQLDHIKILKDKGSKKLQ